MKKRARLLSLLALGALQSCVAYAVAQSTGNALAIGDVRDALEINIWKNEKEVFDNSLWLIEQDVGDWPVDVAILAPAWSYGGVTLRIARRIDKGVVGSLELQVRILSKSGVDLQAMAAGATCEALESFRGWACFSCPEANASPLEVRVRCEVGEWVFRLPETYFAGFERRVTDSVRAGKLQRRP
jgi:hypothetical protein